MRIHWLVCPILAFALASAQDSAPSEGDSWFEKGTAQQRAGDARTAAESFRKARAAGMSSLTLLIRGSIALENAGSRDAAIEWIEAALSAGARWNYFASMDALGELRRDPRFLALETKFGHP
ncbi:MAG: hypothetical protein R2729_29665 [Bryobacteraceae bacterium]